MAGGARSPLDLDGLAHGKTAPVGVGVLAVSLLAVLGSILATLTHYGGGQWIAVVELAMFLCTGLMAWTYVKREFIALTVFFLAFTFPMALNVQLLEVTWEPLPAGAPEGIVLWEKDLFLLILGIDWFMDICLRRGRQSWRLGKAGVWLTVMLATALAFPVHSIAPTRSFLAWVDLLRFSLGFVYLAKKVDSREVLKWMVIAVFAQVWIESLVALAQYITGSPLGLDFLGERRVKAEEIPGGALIRTGALMGHPNRLALWLTLVGPLPLALALKRYQPLLKKSALWATYLLLNLTLFMTFSRAGWVCAVFNFFATYHLVKRRYGKPQIISIWVPLICGAALMVILFFGVEEIRLRLTAPDRGSTFARIPQFITALNIIRHLPFTGTGLNSYTAYIFQYANVDGRYADALRFRVHNGLLLWTAETGLLGGFAYFMLYWTALKKAWKSWEVEDDFLAMVGAATFIGLISWWIKSMYNIHSPLGDFSLWLHLSFVWIVWNCAARGRAELVP